MEESEIKVYEKDDHQGRVRRKYTMKDGNIVRIQNATTGEDLDLSEVGDSIVKNYKNSNYCGNCNSYLYKKDKYCSHCGTKRGDGDFLPFLNLSYCVYGPGITYYYKCKKCKHMWRISVLGSGRFLNYCPKCGAPNPKLTYEKEGECDLVLLLSDKFSDRLSVFFYNIRDKIKKVIELYKYCKD